MKKGFRLSFLFQPFEVGRRCVGRKSVNLTAFQQTSQMFFHQNSTVLRPEVGEVKLEEISFPKCN